MSMNIEKSRRYYDENQQLVLEVVNGADAVNVDFNNTGTGLESNDVQSAIIELHGLIPQQQETEPEKSPRQEEVFLGYMKQNGNWVTQTCIVKPVDDGATYHFKLPEGIVAKVEYGSDNALGNTSSNIFDGDTFTITRNKPAQRISFARYENNAVSQLTLSDVNEMVDGGEIFVYVTDDDIVTHNLAKEPMLFALSKLTFRTHRNGDDYQYDKAPLIAHISDLHGDAQRAKRCLEFCKRYGIDTVVFSGDQVMEKYTDGSDYVFAAAEKTGQHVCFCIGNHETQYTNSVVNLPSESQGTSTNYNNHLSGHIGTLGYVGEDGETTETGYYYHDIASKLIRVIVLDQHDGGVYSPNNSATGVGGRISQAQIDWFIAVLKSTPANYGVLVVMHSPENGITKDNNAEKFFTTCPTSGNNGDNYSYAPSGMYIDYSRPISKIIDAFISRSSYTGGWSTTFKGSSESVSFTADFTSDVNEGVEFIGYLNGHIHQDRIGYLSGTTNLQLNMNIIAGAGLPDAPDDIPIRGTGSCQDAFNIYAIDRDNKKVRILRIGSNVKKDMTMRDYMVISYAPTNND